MDASRLAEKRGSIGHCSHAATAWNEERNAKVAIKDIEAGEEITCDYREWGDDLSFLTAKLQAEK